MRKNHLKKKREALSPRYVRTLEFLRSFSAATAGQIQREVFNDCSLSFVYRELGKLEKAEWIGKDYCLRHDGNKVAAYSLAPKAWGLFDFGEIRPRNGKRAQSCTLLHKLGLVDIHYTFGKLKFVRNYYPRPYYGLYRDLERFSSLCPDALVELRKDGESFFFALEYFAEFHCPQEIMPKIERYCDTREFYGVIFITDFIHVANRIRSMVRAKKGVSPSNIYYGLASEVLGAKEKVTFFGSKDATLVIA